MHPDYIRDVCYLKYVASCQNFGNYMPTVIIVVVVKVKDNQPVNASGKTLLAQGHLPMFNLTYFKLDFSMFLVLYCFKIILIRIMYLLLF